jgi:hypothetical protein
MLCVSRSVFSASLVVALGAWLTACSGGSSPASAPAPTPDQGHSELPGGGGILLPDSGAGEGGAAATTSDAGHAADAGAGSTSGAPACFADPKAYSPDWKPPRHQAGACRQDQLDLFVSVCAMPNSTECHAFAMDTPNVACASCLFGAADDETWAVYVMDPTAPAPHQIDGYRVNAGGCASVAADSEECGKLWQASDECDALACGSCKTQDDLDLCHGYENESSACSSYAKTNGIWCNQGGRIDSMCGSLSLIAHSLCGTP